MSGLFSAIGRGLSAAGYAAGEIYGKQALAEAQSEAEFLRQQRLAEWKLQREAEMAEKSRQQQTERINAKIEELGATQFAAIKEKRGEIEAGITDRSNWTAEHQEAVEQALGERRLRANLRTQAAIETGYISPKDAATLDNKSEIAQLRQEGVMARVQAQLEMARDRLQMAQTIANMRVAARGSDNKTPADQKMIEYLTSKGYKPEDAVAMVMKTDPRQSDPARMAASLATTILNEDRSIQLRAQEAGKSPAELAMAQALALIEQAEKKFSPNRHPTPGAAAPPKPTPTAAPKPAAAAASSPYKVGQTQVIQSGPHKGKTAEWDGQGWKLK